MVRYHHVDADYLKNRQLRKSAGWKLLWALGVGAVISGFFYGWNKGLSAGGFWGMTLATVLMALMYVCMVYSIAELSAALPHAGGFYSFTRNAFGPLGGFICGVTDTIEYVLSASVIVVAIGGYLRTLMPAVAPYWWWLMAYAIFVAVNIRGIELTLKVGLVITVLAVAVLAIFFVGAIAKGAFHPELLFNVDADPGQSERWLPKGWYGVFAALPFAIWFYLAIEQLPLAAEEAHDVVSDMPKALLWGIGTLLILSVFILILNPGVNGGASAIAQSEAPLQDGFKAIFGERVVEALTLLALTGLIASFHSIIYAYGRVLFALSRAGYFPRWISVTGRWHTPYLSLILGAAIGLLCALLIDLSGEQGKVGAALLNMAVFGAVISYALVMFSYIKLKVSRPGLPRPYRSPLGVGGALVGGVLALVALAACLSVEEYRPAVWGTALFLAAAVLYFCFYSSKRLVAQAPEEEVALVAAAERELAH
jgi:ethanolamine permease